jgi:hypothetical protein
MESRTIGSCGGFGIGALETAAVRATTRLFTVLALALMLAGCDKCGNWNWTSLPFGLDACKSTTPKPQ